MPYQGRCGPMRDTPQAPTRRSERTGQAPSRTRRIRVINGERWENCGGVLCVTVFVSQVCFFISTSLSSRVCHLLF